MKNILEKIVAKKRAEVSYKKLITPIELFEKNTLSNKNIFSLKDKLNRVDQPGIIAEFKRKSPSKGAINMDASIEKTTMGYIQAGASALSILTDTSFFGGRNEDLRIARAINNCPILRKDFIIDEYQVLETRAIGADVILLIAAILSPEKTFQLASLAKQIGLEVLLEVHSEKELEHACEFIDMVGVNNRNLKDFTVSIERSLKLFDLIPSQFIKISESGIDTPEKLLMLKHKGYQGFLIGEGFMSAKQPEKVCADFIQKVLFNATHLQKI